jgi:acetyl esterase/lipase
VVVPSYRLSPEVVYPKHLEDLFIFLSFVYKNIKKYNGNPENISIIGHSRFIILFLMIVEVI